MTAVREIANATGGVLQRDWRIFLSYRTRPVTLLVSAFFTLTLFYYLSRLVRVGSFASPDDYYAFAVVGIMVVQILNSTLAQPPNGLHAELHTGTFERLLLSPFGPVASICSTMLFPFLQALATGVIMLVVAALVFGLQVEWATAALALPVAMIGTVAFACFGVVLTGTVLLVKQAAAGTTWIVAGIALISGLYFPVALLPGSIQWLSEVQPFTPTVELMRGALLGTALQDPMWLDIAKILGFALVLMPLSVWLLAICVRAGRRRATVLEY
jgi:ABC-2 type transport system permease protein